MFLFFIRSELISHLPGRVHSGGGRVDRTCVCNTLGTKLLNLCHVIFMCPCRQKLFCLSDIFPHNNQFWKEPMVCPAKNKIKLHRGRRSDLETSFAPPAKSESDAFGRGGGKSVIPSCTSQQIRICLIRIRMSERNSVLESYSQTFLK